MNNILIEVPYEDSNNDLKLESVEVVPYETNYKVVHTPFFASNLAYGDLITIEKDGEKYYYEKHVKISDYSTIQIVFFDENIIPNTKTKLESLGCSCCIMLGKPYISVSIPPEVDYSLIHEYLQKQEKEKVSSYKEACLSEKHSNENT